jgi:lysozyme
MFAAGKRFVFIRATVGLTEQDVAMSNNVTRATAAGILAGVYHHAHPELHPMTNGAVQEANFLLNAAGSFIGPGFLRPVLVIESGTAMTTAELTDWVIAFCDEVIAQRGTGAAPIIYTLQFIANNELDSRLADYDLWIRSVIGSAIPEADDPPPRGFPAALGVFNNWSFWQYSDVGSSGGISPLDLNVCHSEYKSLNSYLIPGAPPPPPIQLTGATVLTNGMFRFSFTNTPGASFSVLTTTNIALPLSNWMVLGAAIEVAPGQFRFTGTQVTNHPQRFFRVRSP